MAVHQCPRCELRFAGKVETASHLVDEHGVDPERLQVVLLGMQHAAHPRPRSSESDRDGGHRG